MEGQRRQGDGGTRGQGDKETGRQGDRETRRQGDLVPVAYVLSPASCVLLPCFYAWPHLHSHIYFYAHTVPSLPSFPSFLSLPPPPTPTPTPTPTPVPTLSPAAVTDVVAAGEERWKAAGAEPVCLRWEDLDNDGKPEWVGLYLRPGGGQTPPGTGAESGGGADAPGGDATGDASGGGAATGGATGGLCVGR